MSTPHRIAAVIAIGTIAALVTTSCGDDSREPAAQPTQRDEASTLYRSPSCGCCKNYEEYLRRHGFDVQSQVTDDMESVRAEQGVPADAESCHTLLIGDYVVEGHVPVEAIADLLADRPAIDGIALPGMPANSPGMGEPDGQPLDVVAIDGDTIAPFGSY